MDQPSIQQAKTADTLRVFVSYSRDDADFADEVVDGLALLGGFEIYLDREAIHEGEAWKARLGALIAGSDVVAFILSPTSAKSKVCRWEVDEAERLRKRIVPVLAKPLGNVEPPPQLAELNYVRFDPEDDGRARSFVAGLAGLKRALVVELAWVREHARLLNRALEWQQSRRAQNRLKFGSDIETAKLWLASHPKEVPPPTELHRDYIAASEQAEDDRLQKERGQSEKYKRANRLLILALVLSSALAIAAIVSGYMAYRKTIEVTELTVQLGAAYKRIGAGQEETPSVPTETPSRESAKMPDVPRGGHYVGKVVAMFREDGRTIVLQEPFEFVDAAGTRWPVPKGTLSDGASLPAAFWPIFGGPFDPKLRDASIVYDYYVNTRTRTKEATDKMFHEALIASGMDSSRAYILYSTVRNFGPSWAGAHTAPP